MVRVTFDLDIESEKVVYQDIIDTIKYLEDVKKSIENRVFEGEVIEGLKIVDGRKSREITENGLVYLTKVLGKEKVFRTIEKPITISELEKLIGERDMLELVDLGLITYKESAKKIAIEK